MLLHFKYLNRTTFANKVLRDKAFDIAKDSKYNWFQYGIASMVYKFFDKRTSGSGIKNENVCNLELPEELSKPIVKNFKKKKGKFTFYWQYLGWRFSIYAINK